MKTTELRQKFLKFFESKGHTIVRSSSLVPHDDPTLLFTNAGMNQFKDVFLGFDKRPYNRATTAQKCVRAGGKHNDLENVGYTARHHTFFEMMGNFSFGDYFKRDAIHFAWEFLTSPEWLNIPKEKLLATVYAEDDEAYNIWLNEIGMPAERIVRIGDNKGAKYASDNFWQMGDTGPCGPCSEIFYDHGEEIWGGIPGSPEEDGDRWIEIWNCVFMQFNRDEQGNMNPLPKPSVDTGMGLERMAAVMQHVHSNYEIDLFQDLLKAVARETGAAFSMEEPSLKVIADHIRSCSFLIADGVLPSNEGRGYVLRRIIRRAVRHGYKLGQSKPFFHKLVADLVKEMGDAYPELKEKQTQIIEALRAEETRFGETLEKGMGLFNKVLEQMNKKSSAQATEAIIRAEKEGISGHLYDKMLVGGYEYKRIIPGEIIFKLYDTYGFPYDLTADMARELGIDLDEEGFNREMEAQRARARAAQSFKANAQLPYEGQDTEFKGYSERQTESKVLALYKDGEQVNELNEGDEGAIVIDFTPFYAESGGQVGDVGYIFAGENRFEVHDTQKIKAAVFGQFGVQTSGRLKVGDSVTAKVDDEIRNANMRNHSATHLMHKALRDVLGEHVEQKGSLVTAESTRFDISHPQAAVHAGAKLLDNAKDLGSAKLVAAQIEADAAALREIVTDLTGKSEQAIVLLAAVNDGKVSLCAGVSKPLTGKVKAGDLVKFAAEQVGGKGGGRPDLAQAGGTDAEKLPEALNNVARWVKEKIA